MARLAGLGVFQEGHSGNKKLLQKFLIFINNNPVDISEQEKPFFDLCSEYIKRFFMAFYLVNIIDAEDAKDHAVIHSYLKNTIVPALKDSQNKNFSELADDLKKIQDFIEECFGSQDQRKKIKQLRFRDQVNYADIIEAVIIAVYLKKMSSLPSELFNHINRIQKEVYSAQPQKYTIDFNLPLYEKYSNLDAFKQAIAQEKERQEKKEAERKAQEEEQRKAVPLYSAQELQKMCNELSIDLLALASRL